MGGREQTLLRWVLTVVGSLAVALFLLAMNDRLSTERRLQRVEQEVAVLRCWVSGKCDQNISP